MKIRFIILSVLLLIISCDENSLSLDNCQDPLNDCYMTPPEYSLCSYSPTSIFLDINNDESESIIIERLINDLIDTSYTLLQNDLGEFIDSNNTYPKSNPITSSLDNRM